MYYVFSCTNRPASPFLKAASKGYHILQPFQQSHLLFHGLLLLLRRLLLTNILEAKPKGKEERCRRESSNEVEDAVNALRVSDKNPTELARIEDLAELGGAGGNDRPGVSAGVLDGDFFPEGLSENRGAEAEEQCSAEHAGEHDHGESDGCLGWWEAVLDGHNRHLEAATVE
jgi:hypothetical protein